MTNNLGNKNTFKYIVHLADIHIRNDLSRDSEYEDVYTNLRLSIQHNSKLNKKNTAIVIAGDVFHDGRAHGKLSPNAISSFKKLIHNLSSCGTIIIIPGNHDNNITYQSELDTNYKIDALQSVLDNFKGINKNIFYLKHSGKYLLGNLVLYHTSVFDIDQISKPEEYEERKTKLIPLDKDSHPQHKHIAILHCGIQGNINKGGYVLKDYMFRIPDVENYDICCLGDTHELQFLGDKQNIAYPNSLIQQNHGETVNNHGYILWDLETFKGDFYNIENKYGFVTINHADIISNLDTINDIPFPNKTRIMYKHNFTDTIDPINIQKQIAQFTEIIEWKTKSKGGREINDICLDELLNYDEEIALFINNKFTSETEETRDLFINKLSNDKTIHGDKVVGRLTCRFNLLTMNNFMGYKGIHSLNFQTFEPNSSIVIYGGNTHGKTTIIKAIAYAIWGPDKGRAGAFINNTSEDSCVTLEFQHSNSPWKIERKLSRSKINTSHELGLYELNDGIWINKSHKHKKTTQKIIDTYFGDKESAKQTWISDENDNKFINSPNNYDIFQTFIGADVFKDIHKNAYGEKKTIEKEINAIAKQVTCCKKDCPDDPLLQSQIQQLLVRETEIDLDIDELRKTLDTEHTKFKFGTIVDKQEWESALSDIQEKTQNIQKLLHNITSSQYTDNKKDCTHRLTEFRKNKDVLNRQLPKKPKKLYKDKCITLDTLQNKLTVIVDTLSKCTYKQDYIRDILPDKQHLLSTLNTRKQKHLGIYTAISNKQLQLDTYNPQPYETTIELLDEAKQQIEALKKQLGDYDMSISYEQQQITTRDSIATCIKDIEDIETKINKYTIKKIPAKQVIKQGLLDLQKYITIFNTTELSYKTTQLQLVQIEEQIKQLSPFTFDTACPCCVLNKTHLNLYTLEKNKTELQTTLVQLETQLAIDTDNKLNHEKYTNYKKHLDRNTQIKLQIDNYKLKKTILDSQNLDLIQKLETIDRNIDEYTQKRVIYQQVTDCEKDILSKQSQVDKLQKPYSANEHIKTEISTLNIKLAEYTYNENEIQELTSLIADLVYTNALYMDKDAIALDISNLNDRVDYNRILAEIGLVETAIDLVETQSAEWEANYKDDCRNTNIVTNNQTLIRALETKIVQFNGYNEETIEGLKQDLFNKTIEKQTMRDTTYCLEKRFELYTNNQLQLSKLGEERIELEQRLGFITQYCSIVDPTQGYPHKLITSTLQTLTQLVNLFINDAGYTFQTTINAPSHDPTSKKQSNSLIITFRKNSQLFNNLSGAEQAVFNIAVQTSLGKLLNTTTPPVQIMDESFSALDEKHICEIPTILDNIKSQFNLILYISHNKSVRKEADYAIKVNNDNHTSSITIENQ